MNNEEMNHKQTSLCFRCEFRAQYHETGYGPRSECKNIFNGCWSCYMYRPVKPIALKGQEGDTRPLLGPWMISSRVVRDNDAEPDMKLDIKYCKKKSFVLYWKPKEKKSSKRRKVS